MDFTFTTEQEALREQAREFLAANPEPTWTELAELGWTGVSIAEESGGAGLGFVEEAVLFEELVESACASKAATLRLRPGPSEILLHGHCHQKSMGLTAPAKALLSRVPDARVVDLDAGCCGMAGSFGYTRGHFDVSRTIDNPSKIGTPDATSVPNVRIVRATVLFSMMPPITGIISLTLSKK